VRASHAFWTAGILALTYQWGSNEQKLATLRALPAFVYWNMRRSGDMPCCRHRYIRCSEAVKRRRATPAESPDSRCTRGGARVNHCQCSERYYSVPTVTNTAGFRSALACLHSLTPCLHYLQLDICGCRCFNPSACIGGAAAAAQNGTSHQKNATRGLLAVAPKTACADFKSAQCSARYQGNLCGECKPGYGKVRSFLCRKCMSSGAIIVLYMLAVIAVVGIIKLLVWFSTSGYMGGRTDLQQPTPAEMLRALVLHSQWLYIICSTVGVPWPSSLSYPMQVVGGIWSSTSGSSLGIDCILRHGRLPVSIQQVLLCLLMPVGILCLVVSADAITRLLRPAKESRRQTHMVHNFASLVMSVVFMFLPAWVNTVLSLFTCVPLDSPVEPPYQAAAVGAYWLQDVSEVCYSSSGYHKRWALGLGIPLTLLFCVALPSGVFVFMWYNRKQGKLGDRQFEKHYGFMYRMWREEVCWWEAVVLVQTVALVMVATFGFAMGAYYQCLVSTTVLAVIGLLLLGVKPFRRTAANNVAVLSICALLFTAQAALSFLPYNNISPGAVYSNIMGVLIMLANLAFLLGATVKLVRVGDWVFIKEVLSRPGRWATCLGDCFKDTMRIRSKDPNNQGPSVVSTIA